MAKAFKIGIGDLTAEFFTHALVFGDALKAAGTVAARHLQTLPNGFYDLAVCIFFDFHGMFSPYRLDF